MMKEVIRIKWLYIITGFIHLLSLSLSFSQVYIQDLMYGLSKIALMPLLIVIVLMYKQKFAEHNKLWNLMIAALLFSFFGDFLLLDFFTGKLFFLGGLSCFLVTHVLYIMIFAAGRKGPIEWNGLAALIFLILILVWAAWFYILIYDALGNMIIPVSLYIIVIGLMAIQAVYRYAYVNRLSYGLVLIGALAFMLSDSFVAWRVFMEDFNHSGVLVMSTYILAQFCIVEGVYRNNLSRSQ